MLSTLAAFLNGAEDQVRLVQLRKYLHAYAGDVVPKMEKLPLNHHLRQVAMGSPEIPESVQQLQGRHHRALVHIVPLDLLQQIGMMMQKATAGFQTPFF